MSVPKLTRGAWHDSRVLFAEQAGYPLFAICQTPQEADQLVAVFNSWRELHAALKVATQRLERALGEEADDDPQLVAANRTLERAEAVHVGRHNVAAIPAAGKTGEPKC